MTPREAITKFHLQYAENDGVPGFRIAKGLATPEEIAVLVAMKPAIMGEFDTIAREEKETREKKERRLRLSTAPPTPISAPCLLCRMST